MSVDMREMIASAIELGVRRHFTGLVNVRETCTTSECPMLELTFETGEVFNVTITRARAKSKS